MGPSIAAGSHGWSPNWADFPVAARIRPSRGSVGVWVVENVCWISQVFMEDASHAMLRMSPMSPIRL